MDATMKRFFHKGATVQSKGKEVVNQRQAPSEGHKLAAPSHLLYLDHPLVGTLWLTLLRSEVKDEYGIKVLCGPDQPRAEYALKYCHLGNAKQSNSVIFVHGLTGGQLSTWTAPGASAPWPSLLLPDDIPDARISTFGYDADVLNLLGSAGQNRIRHHARNLLRGIADMWLDTEVVSSSEQRNAHS